MIAAKKRKIMDSIISGIGKGQQCPGIGNSTGLSPPPAI
jgi:hypothetical protein